MNKYVFITKTIILLFFYILIHGVTIIYRQVLDHCIYANNTDIKFHADWSNWSFTPAPVSISSFARRPRVIDKTAFAQKKVEAITGPRTYRQSRINIWGR